MRYQINYSQQAMRKFVLGLAIVGLLILGVSERVDAEEQKEDDAIQRKVTHKNQIIEQLQLPGSPNITVVVHYKNDAKKPMPVMLGWFGQRERAIAQATEQLPPKAALQIEKELPPLQPVLAGLVSRGCAVVSFLNTKPTPRPWPKGKAKWVWPTPDPAGAHTFAASPKYSPGDWGTVIDWVETRKDLRPDRIGYMGGSTTAIIGYGLISREPRITCAALIAGSGSMREFVKGWKRNYNWKSKNFETWPETEVLLGKWDPLFFVDRVFPTALLMINGSDDKIIPIESARHYYKAIRPHYAKDPDRLRFVVFEGAGHGWDQKWNTFMVVDWFDRYLLQEKPPKPRPKRKPVRKPKKK